MSAEEQTAEDRTAATTTARSESGLSLRVLGILGIIGSPMLLVQFLLFGWIDETNNRNHVVVGALGLVYLCGWMASVIGMRRLRVTGRGLASRIVFIVQLIGLLLAALFSIQELFNPSPDRNTLFFKITDAAWPLSHLFMLVVGLMVLKAGVWRGPRRFVPLLCGLALPAFFAVGALSGLRESAILFGLFTTIAFGLLGYAVLTSRPSDHST